MNLAAQSVSPADVFIREFGKSARARSPRTQPEPARSAAAGRSATVDRDYTRLFIDGFHPADVHQYHRKFYRQFEKNVKHRQQVALVRKYLREDTVWLDAPIGSGRMMDELPLGRQIGFDKSPVFLAHNRAKGREVLEGDLLKFPYRERFDLITTIHTLPAFTGYKDILASLVRGLRPGGILIADINNARQSAARRRAGNPTGESPGMNRREIGAFFSRLGCRVEEIHPHDYFDSPFVNRFFRNPAYRFLNKAYFWLGLYPLLDRLSRGRKEHIYNKYLLVVRKAKPSRTES